MTVIDAVASASELRVATRRGAWGLALLAVLAVAVPGCSIKQIPPTTPTLSTSARGQRVLLLPTRVIYESVDTDLELPVPPEAAERAARIDQTLRERLGGQGFGVVALPDMAGDVRQSVEGVVARLQPRYVRLIGAGRDKSAFVESLADLARLTGAELGCVPVYYARVGKSGGYDPNTGAIWTTTSSTSIRAGLVSLATGERVWFREAFMRSVATHRDLDRALEVLFREE